MDTEAYLDMFFPFGRPNKKNDNGDDMNWLDGLFDDTLRFARQCRANWEAWPDLKAQQYCQKSINNA